MLIQNYAGKFAIYKTPNTMLVIALDQVEKHNKKHQAGGSRMYAD